MIGPNLASWAAARCGGGGLNSDRPDDFQRPAVARPSLLERRRPGQDGDRALLRTWARPPGRDSEES
eukprot:755490-Hanusia_phi.AAC.6